MRAPAASDHAWHRKLLFAVCGTKGPSGDGVELRQTMGLRRRTGAGAALWHETGPQQRHSRGRQDGRHLPCRRLLQCCTATCGCCRRVAVWPTLHVAVGHRVIQHNGSLRNSSTISTVPRAMRRADGGSTMVPHHRAQRCSACRGAISVVLGHPVPRHRCGEGRDGWWSACGEWGTDAWLQHRQAQAGGPAWLLMVSTVWQPQVHATMGPPHGRRPSVTREQDRRRHSCRQGGGGRVRGDDTDTMARRC
jgi:hypothetical protein